MKDWWGKPASDKDHIASTLDWAEAHINLKISLKTFIWDHGMGHTSNFISINFIL